jgi:hypothetical protein
MMKVAGGVRSGERSMAPRGGARYEVFFCAVVRLLLCRRGGGVVLWIEMRSMGSKAHNWCV